MPLSIKLFNFGNYRQCSSVSQFLPGKLNKHVLQRRPLQMNIFELYSLLVEPFHDFKQGARGTIGIDREIPSILVQL